MVVYRCLCIICWDLSACPYAWTAYPFGNSCFLTEDARVQYNTMLRVFLEYIHSGDTSGIMWNHGMGVDVYLNVLYYIMSPFNIICSYTGNKIC